MHSRLNIPAPAGVKAATDATVNMRNVIERRSLGFVPKRARGEVVEKRLQLFPRSSNPALGNNALEAMNQVMNELISLRTELQSKYRNTGFAVQTPTLNLGCIHGGDGANRICGDCELHFDLRLLPGMDNDELRAAIQQRLTPIAERSGTDIVLSSLFEGVDPFGEDEQSELVKICEQLTGNHSESVAFATEAPFMQQLGMQTLVLGPGSINQAHQPDEFIPLDQIEPAVKIVRGLIEKYCL
jgi:acetylornithine deacetylase